MELKPSEILEYLQEQRISVWRVAVRLDADPGHLRRVLTGRREGSQALLHAVMETARTMPGRPHRRIRDVDRLVEAAAHMFFLRRGRFESAIFTDPEEMGLYGPAHRRGRAFEPPKKEPRKKGDAC